MTDLNSQLNYSSNLHYQQQQQQYQNSIQKLQNSAKEKAMVNNNDPNLLVNIPLDSQHPQNQGTSNAQAPGVQSQTPYAQGQPGSITGAQAAAAAASQGAGQAPAVNSFVWNNNFNNNGLFSDTLSPFFAPYGIDVSHFPLTNPPIFESALMMNNHGQPRRRISISNGQIGQITTHSLEGEDLYDSQPPPLPKQISQDDSNINNQSQNQLVYNQLNLDSVPPHVQSGQVPQELLNVGSVPPSQTIPPTHQQQQGQQGQVHPLASAGPTPAQGSAPAPQHYPQQQHQHRGAVDPNVKRETPFPTQGLSGIPSHKLVYNNEVIFNPDAGPIPGTAAWKKARLLERNRIAASKCRQRKKAAHIQLKEDVEKYQTQINRLMREKRELYEFYSTVEKLIEQDSSQTINTLAALIKKIEVAHPDRDDEEAFDDEDDD